jgi:selT/selW/selH-like putative selenoprotein
MQRTFLQAKKYLEKQFPNQLVVDGSNVPIPPLIQLVLNILSFIQLFAMACAIFGEKAFMGRRPPEVYYRIKEHGIPFLVIIFWVIPQVFNKWVITGAFEVMVDGSLIFSKLEVGKLPTALDLTEPLVQMGLVQIQSS